MPFHFSSRRAVQCIAASVPVVIFAAISWLIVLEPRLSADRRNLEALTAGLATTASLDIERRFADSSRRGKLLAIYAKRYLSSQKDLGTVDIKNFIEGELQRDQDLFAISILDDADRIIASTGTPKLLSLIEERLRGGAIVSPELLVFQSLESRARKLGPRGWFLIEEPIPTGPAPAIDRQSGATHGKYGGYRLLLVYQYSSSGRSQIQCLVAGCRITYFPQHLDYALNLLTGEWEAGSERNAPASITAVRDVSDGDMGMVSAAVPSPYSSLYSSPFLQYVLLAAAAGVLGSIMALRFTGREGTEGPDFEHALNTTEIAAVIFKSESGRIMASNPAADELLALTAESRIQDHVDIPLSDISNETGRSAALSQAVLRASPTRKVHALLIRTDVGGGQNVLALILDNALPGGAVSRQEIGRQLDIALRHRVSSLSQQRDNYRRLVELLKNLNSTLAHEMRQPIATIKFAAENLASHPDNNVVRRADKIRSHADTLNGIITKILTAAKLEAKTLSPATQIGQPSKLLAERVLAKQDHDKAHEYSITGHDLSAHSVIDPELFIQVIDNVLDNAAKYSAPGTHICAGATIDNGWVILEVADEGIGIPDAEKEQVFTRFYRASTAKQAGIQGNGLGMAICREIMLSLDGSISVHDGPEGGTVIRIKTPVVDAASVPAPQD